ncbi:ECF transporter S component [Ruicaihuangia caeni]|uniref:ECF transporter S component n=1 Tax=Ruicaihuangia caeni TaxID=3042517 RepID=A0AAW6T5Y7_9MICO|nr:ECF transporter S component [Klugiella sp. YN-L-19]MDI2097759.1 ECF transporter S component [Klugiella sp. YN-L-19]
MTTQSIRPTRSLRWRVVDIVVASVIGVACGVLFVVWNVADNVIGDPLKALLPGLQGLSHGMWLIAGVLTAIIIRKPGAALYGELLAAVVSAVVGNQWGWLTLVSGLTQGLGAELVFAIFAYANFRLIPALLAGAASGLTMAITDLVLWYAGAGATFSTVYTIASIVGGVLLAGLLAWLLAKALARTGVLDRFAAGREVKAAV